MALNVARSTSCPGVAPSQQASNAVHGLKSSTLISTRGDFLKGSPFNPLAGSSTRTRKVTNPSTKIAAKAKESYYIVQKGDSLYRIAKEHDVTLSSLANANSIKIARRVPILPGQRLKIPAVKDRAILNKQEKRRMQEKLKRIAEGPHLSSSREQLRASLIPRVPAQSDPTKATSSNRSSNLVASVAVDTRPVPQSRPAAGWFSFWQPASILLLIGAALFYFIKLKPAAKTVDPNLRKAQAVKSSRLKLKPAPPLPSPLQSSTLQSSPPKSSTIVVEAAVDTAEGSGEWVNTPESKLRFTRVGSTLFSVGSPRVLESLLSSSAQLPRVVTRTSLAPSQYAAERLEARKVLEERLAAARAQLLETHRRAEIAKAKAQQALEASEAAWITVERFRELSSADKKVLWTAEEALERLTLEKELATGLDRKR